MSNERIEELQEKRKEFILNESAYEDDNPSWEEVSEAEAEAEARWNETEEGRELTMLEAGASEITIELYKALKAMSDAFDIGQRATHSSAIGKCRAAIAKAEGELKP